MKLEHLFLEHFTSMFSPWLFFRLPCMALVSDCMSNPIYIHKYSFNYLLTEILITSALTCCINKMKMTSQLPKHSNVENMLQFIQCNNCTVLTWYKAEKVAKKDKAPLCCVWTDWTQSKSGRNKPASGTASQEQCWNKHNNNWNFINPYGDILVDRELHIRH